jgi:hypothetical protein
MGNARINRIKVDTWHKKPNISTFTEHAQKLCCVFELIRNIHITINGKLHDMSPTRPNTRMTNELESRTTKREFINRNRTPKEACVV